MNRRHSSEKLRDLSRNERCLAIRSRIQAPVRALCVSWHKSGETDVTPRKPRALSGLALFYNHNSALLN